MCWNWKFLVVLFYFLIGCIGDVISYLDEKFLWFNLILFGNTTTNKKGVDTMIGFYFKLIDTFFCCFCYMENYDFLQEVEKWALAPYKIHKDLLHRTVSSPSYIYSQATKKKHSSHKNHKNIYESVLRGLLIIFSTCTKTFITTFFSGLFILQMLHNSINKIFVCWFFID